MGNRGPNILLTIFSTLVKLISVFLQFSGKGLMCSDRHLALSVFGSNMGREEPLTLKILKILYFFPISWVSWSKKIMEIIILLKI